MQVNYWPIEVGTLDFVVEKVCDSVQCLQRTLNFEVGLNDSRLIVRSRSPSNRLEEATVCSTMDEKTMIGILVKSILWRLSDVK